MSSLLGEHPPSEFPITPELAAMYAGFPAWLRDNSAHPTEWLIRHDTTSGFEAVTADGARRTNADVYDLYRDITVHEDSATVVFDRALYEAGDITGMVYPHADSDPGTVVDEDDDEIRYAAPALQYAEQGNTALVMVLPKGSQYIMFAGSFAGWIRGVHADFEDFHTLRQDYLQYPQDFQLAYDFVHAHPMGWTKTMPDDKNRGFTTWTPNGDLHLVPHFRTDQGAKQVEWELEYGEHVASDYLSRYMDPDLSVYDAPSPAAAYTTLAARIEAQYHPNGVAKEDIQHEETHD